MSAQALMDRIRSSAVSPYSEVLSFELLYSSVGKSLKSISDLTVKQGILPSQAVENELGLFIPEAEITPIKSLIDSKLGSFSVAINNTPSWPEKLADSARPTPLFYYQGDIGLIEQTSVSIVGSRKASKAGRTRAHQLARDLVKNDIVIVSGLARGIDTAAMTSAIENGGKVIGVIGTPIDEVYPKENAKLQNTVAKNNLLISQVPFYKYAHQPFKTRRFYFPERNELMAAVSDATVIVEASDTSGTLTQARACQHQGRPLFILRSCLNDDSVVWPKKWIEKENVYPLDSVEDILAVLNKDNSHGE